MPPSRSTFRGRSDVTRPSADSRATSARTRSPAGRTEAPGTTAKCAVPGSFSNRSRTAVIRSGGTVTRRWSSTRMFYRVLLSGLGRVLGGGGAGPGRVVVLGADVGAGLRARRAHRGERAQQDLADVEDLDVLAGLALLLLRRQGVAQHRDAERARGGDDVGIELERLLGALHVDPLADLLLHPHPGTAGAAAEAAVLAAVHFLRGEALAGVEDLAPGRVDLVVPAEEARVVVGDLAVDRRDRHEPALLHELAEQLRGVDDLVVPAGLRVLVAERVEAVRAGRDDLAHARHAALEDAVEDLDVLHRLHLEHELVAEPAGRVARAGLAVTEDGELHARGV